MSTELDTSIAVQCVFCNLSVWVDMGSAPICDTCTKAREPLVKQIKELKGELARYEACNEVGLRFSGEARCLHNGVATDLYHRKDEK